MNTEPVDKYFGIPINEWIARIPNELEMDAVGLWQIIPVGRDNFSLTGDQLIDFVRRGIISLLERGAIPVRPAQEHGVFWNRDCHYGEDIASIADNIILEWLRAGVDPNENDLWFALLDS